MRSALFWHPEPRDFAEMRRRFRRVTAFLDACESTITAQSAETRGDMPRFFRRYFYPELALCMTGKGNHIIEGAPPTPGVPLKVALIIPGPYEGPLGSIYGLSSSGLVYDNSFQLYSADIPQSAYAGARIDGSEWPVRGALVVGMF